MSDLIEDLTRAGELAASRDDFVELTPQEVERILGALKAAKWKFDGDPYRCEQGRENNCTPCNQRINFYAALCGDDTKGYHWEHIGPSETHRGRRPARDLKRRLD